MPIDLKRLTRGRVALPPRVVLYSFDGVGKTTCAASAPDPVFLDMNRGSLKFDVQRFHPKDWDEAVEFTTAVETGQVKCKSYVLDSLTELEGMFALKHFGARGPNSGEWQFGRGDTYALSLWREFLAQMERIWIQGKNIIFTAHAKVKKFNDPTGTSYDRFELSLMNDTASAFRQWSDFVLFAREEVLMAAAPKGTLERAKAKTTNLRYMYTRRNPAFDAKARGSSAFPEVLPLGWDSLVQAIAQDEARTVAMRKEIDEMLIEIARPELTAQVTAWLIEMPSNVVETHNRIKDILETKRGESVTVTEAGPREAVAS